jgi:hypothetical protein
MIMPLALLIAALATAPAAEPAAAAPPKPMLICRSSERETGSRIRHGRKCKTAEEWAIEDAERERKPASLRVTEGQSIPTGQPGSPH